METLSFTQSDLDLFSAASHDVNPLHMSEEYAHKTPFGQPVVFGILAAIASLRLLPDRPGHVLASVVFEFHNSLLRDVEYKVQVQEKDPQKSTVKISDTGRLVSLLRFHFRPGNDPRGFSDSSRPQTRAEANDWSLFDLCPGLAISGDYAPDPEAVAQFSARWGLEHKGASSVQIASLLFASYLVGMEIPGRAAMFSRLSLEFDPAEPSDSNVLSYQVALDRLDQRFNQLNLSVDLRFADRALAHGQISAFVRHSSPVTDPQALQALLPKSQQLAGKTALVIGGSRGLGAALVQALALQGADVILSYRTSDEEAQGVVAACADLPGRVFPLKGDAGDRNWCREMRRLVLESYGALDILICSACPPIRPLPFAPDAIERFDDFVAQSVALVRNPMACFIESMIARSGWNVVISSEYVHTLPPDWPHYITAKAGIEGLVQAVARQNPALRSLLVRPPKLLTDQTNTPLGRHGTMAVETVAAAVIGRVCNDTPTEGAEVMQEFGANFQGQSHLRLRK